MDQAEKFRRLTCTASLRLDLKGRSLRAAASTGITGAIDFVLRIGSTAVLARLLLPEHFGLVMMVMAVTAIADQFRDLGLSSATVQAKEISHTQISNLFWINLLAGTLIALIICGAAPLIARYYHEPRLIPITCVLAMNFVLGGLMVQHQALLTRQLKLGHTSTIRLLSSLLSTVLAIVLAWQGFTYWALVWREVFRNLLLALGMWLCFRWVPGLPNRAANVRHFLRFGTDLSAAYVLCSITSGLDRFLLGRFWGAGPVAIYRQAYQLIVTPMEQFFSPVNQVAQPALSLLQTEGERYRRFFQKIVTAIALGTMPLSLFVAIYANEITLVVLGRKWIESAPLLQILALGSFFKWVLTVSGTVPISTGASRCLLYLSVLNNFFLVTFMLIGAHWGATGIAVADAVTTGFMIFPRLYFSFKGSPIRQIDFWSPVFRPAVGSFVMAAVLILFRRELPDLSRVLSLLLGGGVALGSFAAGWLLLPGGRAEFGHLVTDLQSVVRRKSSGPVAASN